MKTLNKLLTTLFICIGMSSFAQQFIASNVRFTKEIETGSSQTAEEIGLVKLNDQNNEFSFDISLFPILTSPRGNDSITDLNRKVGFSFRAEFPASELDFLSNDGSEMTLTLPGEVTVNNITHPVNMILGIHSSMEQENSAMGIKSYPAFVSFVIDINPAEFGLDFETINFVSSISLQVRNGVINRSTQNSITR